MVIAQLLRAKWISGPQQLLLLNHLEQRLWTADLDVRRKMLPAHMHSFKKASRYRQNAKKRTYTHDIKDLGVDSSSSKQWSFCSVDARTIITETMRSCVWLSYRKERRRDYPVKVPILSFDRRPHWSSDDHGFLNILAFTKWDATDLCFCFHENSLRSDDQQAIWKYVIG